MDMQEQQQREALALAAMDELSASLYHRLHDLARSFMAKERQGHTLMPADLAHSAYLRLYEQHQAFHDNPAHFMAMAATMMRRILVNHALGHQAQKRGDGAIALTLSAAELVEQPDQGDVHDILLVNQALQRLEAIDARMVTIVELRYFSGFSIEETAASLGLSPATIKREWATAKLWLMKELA